MLQYDCIGQVSYVNASRISFLRCDQTFLATQAPKPETVAHFWHMVIQEQVQSLSHNF